MASRYRQFPTDKITLFDKPLEGQLQLKDRDVRSLMRKAELPSELAEREVQQLVVSIKKARKAGKPVILFMGAHPIKLGLSRYIVDMIDKSHITHVATTGAGLIHDWQLVMSGKTDEDVLGAISSGRFGFFEDLADLNQHVTTAAEYARGIGEQTGGVLEDQLYTSLHKLSINCTCYEKDIPFTVHVGIGTDIMAMYPNFNGASWGEASYTDFLIFAEAIRNAAGGVFINMGSAVTGPEVFLKAVSMSRNIDAELDGLETAVFDLGMSGTALWRHLQYDKDCPAYYHRPLKTVLKRIPDITPYSDSYWVQGYFEHTIPRLWTELTD